MQFAAKTTGKSQELPRNAETAPAISPRQRNRHPRFGAVAFACSSSSQKQDCPRTVHASINSISEAPAPSQRTGVETASNVLFECPGLTEPRPHHHTSGSPRLATGPCAGAPSKHPPPSGRTWTPSKHPPSLRSPSAGDRVLRGTALAAGSLSRRGMTHKK